MGKGGTTVISFLLGAVVGAAIALLYAPKSGEELRTQIRTEAEIRKEKLSAELEKAMADLQAQADKTRAELMSYVEQMQSSGEVSEPVEVEVSVDEKVAVETTEIE